MKESWILFKVFFSCIGGCLGTLLGGWDGPLLALIAFITVDYITGVMCGIAEHKLSSEIGFVGIFRKVAILMIVGVGAILDSYVIRTGDVLRTAIIFYYISNEGVSILENATRLDLPVPKKIQSVLAQLKEEGDGAPNGQETDEKGGDQNGG